jgi:hypothetical protein
MMMQWIAVFLGLLAGLLVLLIAWLAMRRRRHQRHTRADIRSKADWNHGGPAGVYLTCAAGLPVYPLRCYCRLWLVAARLHRR